MRTVLRAAVVLAALPMALAATVACGGGSGYGSAAPGATQPAATPPAGTTRVELTDNRFQPATLAAKAGTPLTVSLTNAGAATHTFTIDALGVDRTLAPGESVTLTFTPASAGALTFYCRFHRSLGMTGTINVTGAAASGSTTPPPAPTAGSYSNNYGY